MGMSAEDQMEGRLPGGDDTPISGESAAAPTGTPARKWAEKYNSPEELETGYTELSAKLGEQGEEIRRLKDLVLTPPAPAVGYEPYTAAAPQWTPATAESGVDAEAFVSRAEARQMASAAARDEAQRIMREEQGKQYWRAEFFRQNPDLKDVEDIVMAKTAEVGERYRNLPPEWLNQRMPLILGEIAQRTRERLASIRGQARAEAQQHREQVAAGQLPGSPAPAAPPGPKKEPTLEEQRQEAIREEMEAHAKLRLPR